MQIKEEHKGLDLTPWDIKNIRRAIDEYDRQNPRGKVNYQGYEEEVTDPLTNETKTVKRVIVDYCNIDDYLDYVRGQIKKDHRIKLGRKSFDEPLRLTASLPPGLANKLSKGYPTLLTDKKQTTKFLKHFPKFKLD